MSQHQPCRLDAGKPRCHIVWVIVGDYVVRCCAHCDWVKQSNETGPGDEQRAAISQDTHERMCGRRTAWTWMTEWRKTATAA